MCAIYVWLLGLPRFQDRYGADSRRDAGSQADRRHQGIILVVLLLYCVWDLCLVWGAAVFSGGRSGAFARWAAGSQDGRRLQGIVSYFFLFGLGGCCLFRRTYIWGAVARRAAGSRDGRYCQGISLCVDFVFGFWGCCVSRNSSWVVARRAAASQDGRRH